MGEKPTRGDREAATIASAGAGRGSAARLGEGIKRAEGRAASVDKAAGELLQLAGLCTGRSTHMTSCVSTLGPKHTPVHASSSAQRLGGAQGRTLVQEMGPGRSCGGGTAPGACMECGSRPVRPMPSSLGVSKALALLQ
jgi:hypothetical protein